MTRRTASQILVIIRERLASFPEYRRREFPIQSNHKEGLQATGYARTRIHLIASLSVSAFFRGRLDLLAGFAVAVARIDDSNAIFHVVSFAPTQCCDTHCTADLRKPLFAGSSSAQRVCLAEKILRASSSRRRA